MLLTRKEREIVEDRELAPYAARSSQSRGRRHQEAQHEFRTEFQRDRDRIIHSRSFRRLEYKTQVFINGTADHYRTRLTHTFEMAAVGRTIARSLRANEDLTEAIALAHDIGHSPFGHCGEEALNDLMKNHGGFDHNIQSIRWVEQLEQRYPRFPGLNLTWEVRAGLYKHQAHLPGFTVDDHAIGPHQYIEGQIADVADDMTYHAHDIDDGLDAGLLTEESLAETAVWHMACERVAADVEGVSNEVRLATIIREILNMQVQDVLTTSAALLDRFHPESTGDVMACPERLVAFSTPMRESLSQLRDFLFKHLYWHSRVAGANQEAVQLMRKLFLYYVDHPEVMGRKAQARIPQDGVWRAACDYLSGMTDRYALDEYNRFHPATSRGDT